MVETLSAVKYGELWINWQLVWLFLFCASSVSLVAINWDWVAALYRKRQERLNIKPDYYIPDAVNFVAHLSIWGKHIEEGTTASAHAWKAILAAAKSGEIVLFARPINAPDLERIPPRLLSALTVKPTGRDALEAVDLYDGDKKEYVGVYVNRKQIQTKWPQDPSRNGW